MFNALSNNEVATRYANTRCPEAREEVLRRYTDLVRSCLKEYWSRPDIDDLLQEGKIALMQALEKYKPSQGAFSTIAVHYINGKVSHYLRDKGYMIRVPAWVQDHYRREHICRLAFEAATGRQPINEELAPLMGLTVEKLNSIHTYNPRYIRLHSIETYVNGYSESGGERRIVRHPQSMQSGIDGNLSDSDLLDIDEIISVRESDVETLVSKLGISTIEARKLKTSV